MAKQTQSKDQAPATENVVKEVQNTEHLKDAFGDIQTAQDIHNPYSKIDTSNVETVKDPEGTKIEQPAPVLENHVETQVIQPTIQEPIQPTVQEPIKPTLTDQVVYEDFSKDSTVKVKNGNGVVVNLSGTAAKILKNLDATTKIVK